LELHFGVLHGIVGVEDGLTDGGRTDGHPMVCH
jgi:hypothetical protein